MTYEETLHYLYTSTPVFQHSGASAYKPGLDTSIALDNLLENPHQSYRTIHVAGTNGKGSVSHLLAAVLQATGYRVGLYTSPHLMDFRERIRVNGRMISKDYVVGFVARYREAFEPLSPSFFELTSTMAFTWFREQKVDFAIIETGLGGRLDSTNIITPIISIVTNISKDHTQFLGDTLREIAVEKAGIIKPQVPVVTGDLQDKEVANVFIRRAAELNAPLRRAEAEYTLKSAVRDTHGTWEYLSEDYGVLTGELGGAAQEYNTKTVLTAIRVLAEQGVDIKPEAVREGFAHVTALTGLMGRWQLLQSLPDVICDTGHNVGAWRYLAPQLQQEMTRHAALRMVIGVVNDKDIDGILSLMPREGIYYFTQASIERALPADILTLKGREKGLEGDTYISVPLAVKTALKEALPDDLIFIGGSSFIVADALPCFYLLEN